MSQSPVPADLLDDARTLTGALESLASGFSDFRVLTLVDRERHERQLSVGELWSRAKNAQAAFQARGLGPGDAAVLVFPTGAELIAGYLGALLAGGTPAVLATPSNRVADPHVYREHVAAILANASARVLYCEDEVAALFGEDESLLHGAVQMRARDVGVLSSTPPSVPVEGSDLATIQYSSGSTGTPKGVLLTHGAMLNNIRSVREALGITPDDVSVNWIPLYHDLGLVDAFLLPLLSGCPTVLIPTMEFVRAPVLWLEAISRHRGTLSWSPNFGYAVCARRIPDAELPDLDLSSWRIAINGAEPVLADTLTAFCERFEPHGFRRATMTPAYGLAETGALATTHRPDEVARVEYVDRGELVGAERAVVVAADADGAMPSVSVGAGAPRCEFEIRDDGGLALPDRKVGEVWLRTDCLFSAYKGDPDLTARTLVDGWLLTGDRGYAVDGYLYFVSRSKDLIVIGGDKYAPHDVEAAINRVEGVREGCAVTFGILNEERGTEEMAAVVETRESDIDARAALERAIRAEVARATGVGLRHLLLVAPGGVEKTTSGKLARAATRRRWFEAPSGG